MDGGPGWVEDYVDFLSSNLPELSGFGSSSL